MTRKMMVIDRILDIYNDNKKKIGFLKPKKIFLGAKEYEYYNEKQFCGIPVEKVFQESYIGLEF